MNLFGLSIRIGRPLFRSEGVKHCAGAHQRLGVAGMYSRLCRGQVKRKPLPDTRRAAHRASLVAVSREDSFTSAGPWNPPRSLPVTCHSLDMQPPWVRAGVRSYCPAMKSHRAPRQQAGFLRAYTWSSADLSFTSLECQGRRWLTSNPPTPSESLRPSASAAVDESCVRRPGYQAGVVELVVKNSRDMSMTSKSSSSLNFSANGCWRWDASSPEKGRSD